MVNIQKQLELRANLANFDVDDWERECGPHHWCEVIRRRMKERGTLSGDKVAIVAVLRLRDRRKYMRRLMGQAEWRRKNRGAAQIEVALLADCRKLRKAALLADARVKEERKGK